LFIPNVFAIVHHHSEKRDQKAGQEQPA